MRTLLQLPIGGIGVIKAVHTEEALHRRLSDLGLTRGCIVKCLFAAPSGDPRAYQIRGTVIALRNGDAAGVEVEE